MNYLKLLLLLLACTSCKRDKPEIVIAAIKLTKIDSLKTEAQIQQFVREKDSNYKKFDLRKIADFKRYYGGRDQDSLTKLLAKKLNVYQSFYKSDIDNNGYTDLIVIGDNHTCSVVNFEDKEISCDFSVLALLNFGKDSIVIKRVQKDHDDSVVPKINEVNGLKVLSLNYKKYNYAQDTNNRKLEDISMLLAYKFGGFIEYADQQEEHAIKKIEFTTGPCFGSCPIFKLEINNDRKANLWAEENNYDRFHFNNVEEFKKRKEVKGRYTVMVTKDKYQEIVDLLTYIDFKNLQDSYQANGTCQATSFLKITYDNGKVKGISDYGINGTYGLASLYNKLCLLRFNQNWKQQSKQAKVELF